MAMATRDFSSLYYCTRPTMEVMVTSDRGMAIQEVPRISHERGPPRDVVQRGPDPAPEVEYEIRSTVGAMGDLQLTKHRVERPLPIISKKFSGFTHVDPNIT